MTTSTPPAWAWLEEKYVPVSSDSPNLSVSDTLREQNDSERGASSPIGKRNDNPDPTYQDCWPSERYPSDGPERAVSTTCGSADCADQRPDCRCAPGQPHAAGCAGVQSVRETPTNLRVGARNEHPIDDNPLLNHMECTFNSCMDIAVAKNEGYAGSADPMANFKDSVRLGVPVPIGVALRLSDKWARLCRLLQTGENPLADESITDTIMDAVNYLAILLYAMETE